MHDAPTIWHVAEDQGEATVRIIVGAFQFPPSKRHRGIRTKWFDFKVRECQCPHFGAITVFLEVTVTNGLPATRHFIAGNKYRSFCAGITIHETIDVTVIPSPLLRAQNSTNFGDHAILTVSVLG